MIIFVKNVSCIWLHRSKERVEDVRRLALGELDVAGRWRRHDLRVVDGGLPGRVGPDDIVVPEEHGGDGLDLQEGEVAADAGVAAAAKGDPLVLLVDEPVRREGRLALCRDTWARVTIGQF